jgi:lipopolysaccharide transport system ATP-binding protein
MAGNVVFDGVWKRFRRGLAHDSLRDMIPALARRLRPGGSSAEREFREGDFWAVRDVSFEVKAGQALGIIGGNGAGKSTTLKLLTRVLTPTRGTAAITGRVGALIEVSAGFHPDLTGRENVFLQGAIMGMPMQLIRERFDEIVEFSGIPAFIDTPVKRYSSGMNARLGFAIAAHLEPEVLIIDEVLSVGDAEFQARAFGRIKGLVGAGIPVVIVSHQLDRVVELCTDCILLQQGSVVLHGSPQEAVQAYLHGSGSAQIAPGTGAAAGIGILAISDPNPEAVTSGQPFRFSVSGEVTERDLPLHIDVSVCVYDMASNQLVYALSLRSAGAHPTQIGGYQVDFQLQANLKAGLYRIDTLVWDGRREVIVAMGPNRMFQVLPGPVSFDGNHQLNAVGSLVA